MTTSIQASSTHAEFPQAVTLPENFKFREKLAKEINDIERVDVIFAAYKELTQQVTLTKEIGKSFEEWLLDKSCLIGYKHCNYNDLYQKVNQLVDNAVFRAAYSKFIEKIAYTDSQASRAALTKTQKNIVLLFNGNSGGGHKAAAVALAEHFQKTGQQIKLIDVDEVDNRHCPRVNGHTESEVYQEVYQKEGNTRKAHDLSKRINKLYTSEKRRCMTDVKKMILDFQADHIFSIAHHKPKLSYLSFSLGIPMTYVHTDHSFSKKLIPLVKEQKRIVEESPQNIPLITFTNIATDTNFLNRLYKTLKINKQKQELPTSITKQLVALDIPVRSSFCPVSLSEMHTIRDTLNVPREAIVCKLVMGQNGESKSSTNILKQLIKEANTRSTFHLRTPLYVFVVCGKNAVLKSALEELVTKELKAENRLYIRIHGFLEEQEMAQIDKASDVWITKSGGSTSSELVQTQKQMLYVPRSNHPWEEVNAEYLEKIKLAKELEGNKPIISQIHKRVVVHSMINPTSLPVNLWKSQATLSIR